MDIVVIHKANFHKRPPVINVVLILHKLGHNVTLITTGISEFWSTTLKEMGIDYYVINDNISNVFSKTCSYFSFNIKAFKILDSLKSSGKKPIVWVENSYTVVSLGLKLRKFKYIFQIQELSYTHLQEFFLSRLINNALCVFMPEYNRCIISQVKFNMKNTPIVLPNKPYFLPSPNELIDYSLKFPEYVEYFKNNKVVLYQGVISPNRDLRPFIRAIQKTKLKLVILGKDYGPLQEYLDINPDIVHINYIPAPMYLLFSSLCYIGIVTYDRSILNNVYCAPNKIFEYGSFSKPMLGNDIPGLHVINKFGAGRIVDEKNENDILKALIDIEENYDAYSRGAKNLYDKTDNISTIKNALSEIKY